MKIVEKLMTYDLIITDSHVMTPNGMVEKNIVIDSGKIKLITNDTPSCDKKINGSGLVSIPGVIDPHVHYGVYSPIDQAAKTESHAAAIGGVTTMIKQSSEQPFKQTQTQPIHNPLNTPLKQCLNNPSNNPM